MSNETKWNVFEVAMNHAAKSGWVDYSEMMNRYDAALPDNLPVIPEAAGEILRSAYGQTKLLDVLYTAKNGYKVSETLAWINGFQNTFSLAWVLGVWRVQETWEIVKLEVKD